MEILATHPERGNETDPRLMELALPENVQQADPAWLRLAEGEAGKHTCES